MSECGKLAQTEYKGRHDNVARYIHWQLLINVDLKELIAGMNRSLREWWKLKTSRYCGITKSSVIGKSRQEDQTWSLLISRRQRLS